jgi:hypothetical protein
MTFFQKWKLYRLRSAAHNAAFQAHKALLVLPRRGSWDYMELEDQHTKACDRQTEAVRAYQRFYERLKKVS